MSRKSFIDVAILYQKRISISEENFNFKTSFTMLNTKNYPCAQCGKRIKSTNRLTRHQNACKSLPLRIQPDRNTPMLAKDDNAFDHFIYYKEDKYLLDNKEQKIRENLRDLISQCSDNESLRNRLPRHTSQVEMKLDWLHDWIPVLAIFVKHSKRVYANKDKSQNMSVRRDIDPEWVSSFFVQLHGIIQY